MPSFAKDLQLLDHDLQLLRAAARGDKRELGRAVERFYPVIVGLACHRLKDFTAAQPQADAVARGVFLSLLRGDVVPEDFARETAGNLEHCVPVTDDGDGSEGLHSLHGAGKLVRRRAAGRVIRELPLAPLLALLLRYHASWTTEAMLGIVADTPDDVREALVSGHRAVVEAMRGGG